MARKNTFRISNIVLRELSEVSYDQYNAALFNFHDEVLFAAPDTVRCEDLRNF
jgi:hypothetical protein